MTRRAMLFPGQGAQFPGMGKDFFDAFPESKRIFERADEVLGFDLSKVCFEGPEEEVNRTDICQPGILTVSLAILEMMKARHGLLPARFQATAGLSLGEYTALVFAEALAFEDAVDLVSKRGRFMQEDSDRHPSGMMTLIGTTPEGAGDLCRQAGVKGVLVAANYLAPGQIAISGSLEALAAAEGLLREFGVKRGIRLKVAGAFHSPLMREGGEKLKAELARRTIRPPRIPFASNVTGGFVKDPEEIRDLLSRQVTSPVLWNNLLDRFREDGITDYFEPGPGKVLAGLVKKADRGLETFNLEKPDDKEAFAAGLSAERPA